MPEDVALDLALKTNGRIGYVYENVLQGFSITVPSTALAGIQRDPRVAYVEPDLPVSIFAQTLPTGIRRIFADTNSLRSSDGNDYRVDADVARARYRHRPAASRPECRRRRQLFEI
jgi:subtilisin